MEKGQLPDTKNGGSTMKKQSFVIHVEKPKGVEVQVNIKLNGIDVMQCTPQSKIQSVMTKKA